MRSTTPVVAVALVVVLTSTYGFTTPLKRLPPPPSFLNALAKSKAESRLDRFRSATGYAESLETDFSKCSSLQEEDDCDIRGKMLIQASIDLAVRKDANKPLFIQTVTEIAGE